MTENDGPTFCRRMRDATKAIHDTSDKLVNLKLGLSMSNDMVWANGLLVFAKVCKIHQLMLLVIMYNIRGRRIFITNFIGGHNLFVLRPHTYVPAALVHVDCRCTS